jgi:hypothetical protein
LSHPQQAPPDPAFHRTKRNVHSFRQFVVRDALEERRPNRAGMTRFQLIKAVDQTLPILAVFDLREYTDRAIDDIRHFIDGLRAPKHCAGAKPIDRPISCDCNEPCHRARAHSIECAGALPYRQVNFLEQVLCLASVF